MSNNCTLETHASLPRRIAGQAWRLLRRGALGLMREDRHLVFAHRGPYSATRCALGFACYARHDDVPADVLAAMARHGGPHGADIDRREMDEDAILWVAMSGGQPAGVLFSRRGRHFRAWFVALADRDVVLFRMKTFPEFRGQGIAPDLLRHAMQASLRDGGNAYVDCTVSNKASARSIGKAGFVHIATLPPLSREAALGGRVAEGRERGMTLTRRP